MMWVNKNRNIKLIIFLLLCVNIFSVNVFAQNTTSSADICADSNICGAPSEEFKAMTDLVREMIVAIKTMGTAAPYVGKYVSPNRFEGGQFNPPKQGLVSKWTTNIKQKLEAGLAVANIFTSLKNRGGIKDVGGGLAVLFKNNVFVRDYKTLMQMDSVINDKRYELGLAGGQLAVVNDANLAQFQEILNKYGPEGEGILRQAEIKAGTRYGQIISLMVKINSSLKTFLSVGWTGQFKTEFSADKSYIDNPHFILEFNSNAINNMAMEYGCARGLSKCDSSISKFKENIKKISASFSGGYNGAWKKITDAVDKLSKENFQNTQNELMKSVYGLDTNRVLTGGFLGLKNYRSMIVDSWSQIKGFPDAVVKDFTTDNNFIGMFPGNGMSYSERKKQMKEIRAEIAELRVQKQSNKDDNLMSDELIAERIINVQDNPNYNQEYDAIFGASIKSINDAAKQASLDAEISNNMDVTYSFQSIFDNINTIITTIIGSRNKDDSLIKNLGDACKEQCKNAGGKCFY